MPLPFYGCQAHGGKLISLDDQAVWKDLTNADGSGGSSYIGYFRTTPLNVVFDVGFNKLRRLVQKVVHAGVALIKVTPFRDGQESGPVIERALQLGDVGIITAPFDGSATEFDLKVSVEGFNAEVQFGNAEVYVVGRRRSR
jgi:hypothetical protein